MGNGACRLAAVGPMWASAPTELRCDACSFVKIEETTMERDRRRYLHCNNSAADHRCGWIVKVSSRDGRFGDCPAPAWCPERAGS